MLGRIRRYLDLYDSPLAKFDGFCHWLDRWHLMPQRLLYKVCDRFEAQILATGDGGVEMDAEIAAGRTTFYANEEDFLAALKEIGSTE
jgi:hypothetical protein